MNWGKGITIFIICFVLFIAGLVYASYQVKVPLVAENYYEKELDYQSTIDARSSLKALGEVDMQQEYGLLAFKFPIRQELSASIEVICFNESENDFNLELSSDSLGVFRVPTTEIAAGQYELSFKVKGPNKGAFFYQTRVLIP